MSAPGTTPGPWAVGYGGHEVFSAADEASVCQTLGNVVNGPANARLIAAAPDLYAALDRACLHMELSRWAGSTSLALELRAALARARGDS